MSQATHYPLSQHTFFPYRNRYSYWRCIRQQTHGERTHFKESYANIAVKRVQHKNKLKRMRSHTKRKGGTLDGLADDLPQPMTEAAAALLLRHKRRNRPGHTHGTAPRRRGRRYLHTHHTHHG